MTTTESLDKPSQPQALDADEARKRAALSKRLEATLGQFVVLLMRSPHYKHHTIGDLEWLVAPPILAGQYALAEAQSKTSGFTAPIAAVTWAKVSPSVSTKLRESLERPFRLRPDEWKSGEEIWVIDALGDPKVIAGMLQRMAQNEWKGSEVRLRLLGQDGKPEVKLISDQQAA